MKRAPKILIVDDDADLCDMLQFYFRNLEYDVHVAQRAAVAMRIAQDVRPDVILLDLTLPDADGYTVARTLRTDRYTQHIPIIILTASSDQADRLAALELGAEDFVTKPFDAQELRLRIERVLKSS